MNAIILLSALSAGQPGGVYLPQVPQPGAGTTAQPPMTLPMTQPMGMPPMGMPPTGMPPAKNGNGNGNGEEPKAEEPKAEEPAAPEPWALMRVLKGTTFGNALDERGISISGWVQGNYTASTARRSNLPVTFNDRGDFWQMNQHFLRVNKDIDTSKDEFQLGWRTEWILPGTDARFTQSRGLFNGQTGDYQIDLIQAYAEAFFPTLGPKGTSVKLGKFATHVGYELMQGAETPFVSRSYLFQYNPFTHSGFFATSQLNDDWTVSNGLAVGSDNFFGDTTNRVTYLGQLKWAPKEGKSSVLFNAVVTDPRFDQDEAFPHYNVYNMVYTRTINDNLTYVADAFFSHIDGAPRPDGSVGSATWYGASQYLIYKHCDEVTSTLRAELFEDTKGFRTGSEGLYTAVTYGLAIAPKPGLIFRPTVRYDHNNTSRPFEGKPDLFTAAFDMIIRY